MQSFLTPFLRFHAVTVSAASLAKTTAVPSGAGGHIVHQRERFAADLQVRGQKPRTFRQLHAPVPDPGIRNRRKRIGTIAAVARQQNGTVGKGNEPSPARSLPCGGGVPDRGVVQRNNELIPVGHGIGYAQVGARHAGRASVWDRRPAVTAKCPHSRVRADPGKRRPGGRSPASIVSRAYPTRGNSDCMDSTTCRPEPERVRIPSCTG